MAECSRCKVETQLHVNGAPVCPDCDNIATQRQESPTGLEITKSAVAFSAPNSDGWKP